MQNNQQQGQTIQVDLTKCESIACDTVLLDEKGGKKICGSLFKPKVEMKIVSAIYSPTGSEITIPVMTFFCENCGKRLESGNTPMIYIMK